MIEAAFADWIKKASSQATAWTILRPKKLQSNLPRLEVLDDGSIFSTGDITKRDVFTLTIPLSDVAGGKPITALRLEAMADERLPAGGPGRAYYEGRKGDFFLSEVTGRLDDAPIKFASVSHSYGKISIGSGSAAAGNVIDGDGSTGWSTAGREGASHRLILLPEKPLAGKSELQVTLLFERHFAASLGRFRLSAATSGPVTKPSPLPVEIEALLAAGASSWSPKQRAPSQAVLSVGCAGTRGSTQAHRRIAQVAAGRAAFARASRAARRQSAKDAPSPSRRIPQPERRSRTRRADDL